MCPERTDFQIWSRTWNRSEAQSLSTWEKQVQCSGKHLGLVERRGKWGKQTKCEVLKEKGMNGFPGQIQSPVWKNYFPRSHKWDAVSTLSVKGFFSVQPLWST